jgi:hypothetical protein
MLFKRPQGAGSFLAGMQHLHNFYCPNIYTPQPAVNLLPEAGERKNDQNSQNAREFLLRGTMGLLKGPDGKISPILTCN